MGILNITPDSFSDGGKYNRSPEKALKQAKKMLKAGADIIDIGGESTRPGALKISTQEEIARVVPLIELIKKECSCTISIDTSKAKVMQAAVKAGADIINDVKALQGKNALKTAIKLNVPVCLMHMQGTPKTMQQAPKYQNVVEDVLRYLLNRAHQCQKAGLKKQHIILDLGFGFGKTQENNLTLLKNLNRFCNLGYPILVGISRKTMIGEILNQPINKRLYGSLSAAVYATMQGAKILRVHDVKETVQAIQIIDTLNKL